MAKIKFGMMMTDARGKLGGQVFSKNRSGAYVRTKVTPSNPQSTLQQLNRSRLGSISSAWGQLAEEQRNQWNDSVDEWKKTNVFGDLQRPTGKNLFTGLNKVRLAMFPTLAVQVAPPSKAELAPVVINRAVLSNTTTGNLTIFLSSDLGEGKTFQVRVTPPVQAGVSYVKNLLRNIGIAYTASENSIDMLTDYKDRYGVVPVGMKVFIEVREVLNTGQLGVPNTVLVAIL